MLEVDGQIRIPNAHAIDVAVLRGLIREWRRSANGHYCQIYNKGMAQGLRAAADNLEDTVNAFAEETSSDNLHEDQK